MPKLFVGIAFDSGGVASGPMTATFILSFTQGASECVEGADVLIEGFGVISMEAAQTAGAVGGTIINARGAGKNETSKFCLMDIEPEKEILLLVTEKERTSAITENINEMMDLEEHGNGIMIVQEISKAYGLYKEKAK